MARRSTGAVVSALAWLGGVVEKSRNRRMERPLHVTLFSEPGYQGVSRELECTGLEALFEQYIPLQETGLPSLGSIRVERYTHRFLPALDPLADLWSALTSRDDPEAFAWYQVAISSLPRMFNPRAWWTARGPNEDRQSWVRLWAEYPRHSLQADNGADGLAGEPWREIHADTAELGVWAASTRYLELGVSNPNHVHAE